MQISVGASVSTHRHVQAAVRPAVLLAMGQSNMVDRSGADTTAVWPSQVQVFDPSSDALVPPTKNLTWLPSVPGATTDFDRGPGHAVRVFATHWCQAHPDRPLYILPVARGGTGFKDEWYADGTGPLYNETTRLLDVLLAQHPKAEIIAGIMQNGERDAGQKNACYQWNAVELIARLRERYGAALPFVWGEPGNFSGTSSSDFDRVRAQIRALPNCVPALSTARAQDGAQYDSLTDIGDGMHFDRAGQEALGQMYFEALSKLSGAVSHPAVALVWQSAGIPNWNSFDVAAYDIQSGDQLLVLTAAHRSSGNAYPDSVSLNGQTAQVLYRGVQEVTTRVALSASVVTLFETPETPLVSLQCSWEKQPLGGAISIWRIRGREIGLPQLDIGTGSLTLEGASGGVMAALAYGVDTAGELGFSGLDHVSVEGAGNVYATSFAAGLVAAAGTVTITPQRISSHGCGVIGLPITS